MLSLQSNTILLPDETLDELNAALKSLDVRRASSYPDTWGEEGLRQDAKALTPNWSGEVLVTGSATQALMLSLRHVGRGKVIAVQVPCYFGILRQAKELEMIVRPWKDVDDLATIEDVDAIVLTSNLTPPHGRSMNGSDKQRVAVLAARHDAWVIEDNAYEALWFYRPPHPVPSDPSRSIRIGSTSKIVSPDFRVGFVRAETKVLEALRARKITMELSTTRFVQQVVRAGITPVALQRWRDELKARSKAMCAALEAAFGAHVPLPEGGTYVSLPLPEGLDVKSLVAECLREGLLVDDNRHNYPDGRNRPYLRLHCGSVRVDDIQIAVAILARAVAQCATT